MSTRSLKLHMKTYLEENDSSITPAVQEVHPDHCLVVNQQPDEECRTTKDKRHPPEQCHDGAKVLSPPSPEIQSGTGFGCGNEGLPLPLSDLSLGSLIGGQFRFWKIVCG